jgi:glycosyltransferase involved in cell wall biosynthesis
MEISVVIPTYRRPVLLMNCLHCLEKQVLEKDRFEVIVVSDGYDAETESVLNDFVLKTPLQLRYLHTPEKKGPASARNMGWMIAAA